jgi:hypothetical protein
MKPHLSLVTLALGACTVTLVAQTQNPVYRHNRSFYTSMWTTNPPEYTTAGQTVAAGTMHWRAFLDQADQRREPRRVTGIGTWWQPSDPNGTFPQTINTLEFRFYPTTTDAAGLVVPDLAQQPLATLPPTPLAVPSGGAFKSVTIAFGATTPVTVNADFAICAVYPGGASSTTPGFFGLLPSAANEAYRLPQSYYGFAYPGGPITHFPLGGARSSIFHTEDQPTLSVRANWAITDSHFQNGHLSGAFGDSAYFSPLADAGWAGWGDTRNPATMALTVFAAGRDGDFPILLFNFGSRFLGGIPFLGHTLEVLPVDPLLTGFSSLSAPVQNGRFDTSFALLGAARAGLAGTYLGFEAALIDPATLTVSGTTQSVWVRN